ncbi:hypothetical protein ON010_g16959 [Phytophthora cinnamomi]|nr:hypothetical protein ON010_g16959 [Phytophthora cinnamomi]
MCGANAASADSHVVVSVSPAPLSVAARCVVTGQRRQQRVRCTVNWSSPVPFQRNGGISPASAGFNSFRPRRLHLIVRAERVPDAYRAA